MGADLHYPKVGDVVFYSSGKAHGKAIKLVQQQLGFERPELMHAALLVGGGVLVEATTSKGVGYVSLFESKKVFTKYRPTTILRHPNIAQSRSIYADLWTHSYYYYKQKYDWVGALQRHRANDKRKICSTLVQLVLSRLDQFSDISAIHGEFQIFPAELFGVLHAAGFEEIAGYFEPDDSTFGRRNDLAMLKTLEQRREMDALSAASEHWRFIGAGLQEITLFRQITADATQRLAMSLAAGIPTDRSPLAKAVDQVKNLETALATLKARSESVLVNWQDKPAARENLREFRKSLEYEHDLTCREIEGLGELLETALPEFIKSSTIPADEAYQAYEALFKYRFLDVGATLQETKQTLTELNSLSHDLEQSLRNAGIPLGEANIRETVSRFVEAILMSNARFESSFEADPQRCGAMLVSIDRLILDMTAIVKKGLPDLGVPLDAFEIHPATQEPD